MNVSYNCEKCNKSFSEERYLKQHQNKRIPCDKIHKCVKCDTVFDTAYILRKHLSRKTACAPDTVPVVSINNVENRCQFCNKTYSSKSNLTKHQKKCNTVGNPQAMQRLMDMVTNLTQKVDKLEGNQQTQTINNNLTVNQNLYVNVTICSFGSEDLTKLDQQGVIDLLKGQVEDFMPRMIEYIHANPKHPEYHNVFYDPVRKKALVFRQNQDKQLTWEFEDIEHISKLLTNKIKDHIHPLNGPYFNSLAKEDTETANKIPQILCTNWETPVIVESTKTSLSKVIKNEGFMEKVSVLE